MRTLLALLFALVITVTMMHAGAVNEDIEVRTKVERNLLSETALGRKGMGSHTTMKVSAGANINAADSVNNNKGKKSDDDNDSFQNYSPKLFLSSHHYFHIRTPPING
ncbi:hypothetical protein VNO78_04581 [Psophocarpus tetragonolobus]|uniref:Uncharacterized protein n=1 Tax=Psophocarpus tetragonolobus TaxID=3891 RepID=A0AAN9XWD1_PSOTE